jgi:hypothetical protein
VVIKLKTMGDLQMINSKLLDKLEWEHFKGPGYELHNVPEYNELSKKHSDLYCLISKLLPVEVKSLVDDLDVIANELEAWAVNHAYKLGFKDGAQLMLDLGLEKSITPGPGTLK